MSIAKKEIKNTSSTGVQNNKFCRPLILKNPFQKNKWRRIMKTLQTRVLLKLYKYYNKKYYL